MFPVPCPACLCDLGKMCKNVHVLAESRSFVGTEDACRWDAVAVVDEFWPSTARMLDC